MCGSALSGGTERQAGGQAGTGMLGRVRHHSQRDQEELGGGEV